MRSYSWLPRSSYRKRQGRRLGCRRSPATRSAGASCPAAAASAQQLAPAPPSPALDAPGAPAGAPPRLWGAARQARGGGMVGASEQGLGVGARGCAAGAVVAAAANDVCQTVRRGALAAINSCIAQHYMGGVRRGCPRTENAQTRHTPALPASRVYQGEAEGALDDELELPAQRACAGVRTRASSTHFFRNSRCRYSWHRQATRGRCRHRQLLHRTRSPAPPPARVTPAHTMRSAALLALALVGAALLGATNGQTIPAAFMHGGAREQGATWDAGGQRGHGRDRAHVGHGLWWLPSLVPPRPSSPVSSGDPMSDSIIIWTR